MLKHQHSTTIELYFAATIETWPAKYETLLNSFKT